MAKCRAKRKKAPKMLAILELPDKTAHKGLSCFSSNKVRPNHINDDINGARRAAA